MTITKKKYYFLKITAIYLLLSLATAIIWALIGANSYKNDPYAISFHGTNRFGFWFPLTWFLIVEYSWVVPLVVFTYFALMKDGE